MNQIAAFLAPTALPNVAGPLAHAETAAAQGTNFAALLAQFRAAVLDQSSSGEATPDANALEANDVVQAAPPPAPLSPLDILALPPSKPRTDPDAIGEGGAAVIPPHLTLLQLVFPAAQAQPPTVAADQLDAGEISLPGLRGTLLPGQAAQFAPPHLAQSAPAGAPTSPVQPAPADGPTPPAPSAVSYKASETAVGQAAAPVELLTALPKLKPADAPRPPKPAAPAQRSEHAQAGRPAQTQAPTQTGNATSEASPAQNEQRHGFNPYTAPSASPVNKDTAAANQPAPPLAFAPTAASPALFDVRTINAAVVAPPQASVPLDALAVHVARKFQEGSSQFEIRLHPMELGRLDISLAVTEDGRVQAVLRVERPETLDMLQRDARLLEQQLRQAGLEVGSNALSFSLSNGNGQRQAPFTGWPAFADAQTVDRAAKDEAASTHIAVRTRDGVDIRV